MVSESGLRDAERTSCGDAEPHPQAPHCSDQDRHDLNILVSRRTMAEMVRDRPHDQKGAERISQRLSLKLCQHAVAAEATS